jgi:hypothetical protein
MEISLLVVGIPVLVGVSVAAIEITRREGKIALPFFLIGAVGIFFEIFAPAPSLDQKIRDAGFQTYRYPSAYASIKPGDCRQTPGNRLPVFFSCVINDGSAIKGYTGLMAKSILPISLKKTPGAIEYPINSSICSSESIAACNAVGVHHNRLTISHRFLPNRHWVVSGQKPHFITILTPHGVPLPDAAAK